jgi:polyisoprenoid-binding protein YceI
MRKVTLLIAAALIATPLLAQMPMPKEAPGKPDPKRVVAGAYTVDTPHTLVAWEVDHMGFNEYFGLFGGATGSLTLDPAHPAKDSVTIDVPISGLTTTNAKLNTHLSTPDFFDVAKYATAHFASTMIMVKGTTATIQGNLTLHGVTKPITLNAKFTGAGTSLPMAGSKATVGFEAKGVIKRSDFGMGAFVPMVSDAVELKISAAFEK